MYKSHGKAYPRWLQTSLDRNWDGVAWNFIQGMAQCIFTQCVFVWGKTLSKPFVIMTAGCAMLSYEPNETGCPVCPLPGQGQLWHPSSGALQSCWQHPQVFICALCQLAWKIFFFLVFLIYYISCPHPEQQKGEFGILLPTAVVQTMHWSTQLCWDETHCEPEHFSIKLSNSSKQMFIFKSNFSLCYSNKRYSHPRCHIFTAPSKLEKQQRAFFSSTAFSNG